jgi:hypothetical protein
MDENYFLRIGKMMKIEFLGLYDLTLVKEIKV